MVSPEGTSIRSRVHEYGGGAWCLLADTTGSFAFVEDRTQRVMAGTKASGPAALGAEPPADEQWRHGGLIAGPDSSVLAVRERIAGGRSERSIVRLESGGNEQTLCIGRDFYGSMALAPGGRHLAWVLWDHPDMPWDATELWVGRLTERGLGDVVRVGTSVLEGCSVDQPVWTSSESLCFVADAAGWWQPWRWRKGAAVERLCELEAEFQGPAWGLGQHTLVALEGGGLGCLWRRQGTDHLGILAGHVLAGLAQPCVTASSLCAHRGSLAWLGQSATSPPGVWWWSGEAGAAPVVAGAEPLDPDDVSLDEPLVVDTGPRPVHAAFYAPRRSGWSGPAGEAPPLVVFCHGGPTASFSAGFDPVVQMLTTRGYAVATVDYTGSTGYGRRYREALQGRWGVDDVDDCVSVAAWLAETGRVDGTKMAIRGGSAGGLSALGALVRSDRFCGAVSWYGVSDLMGLVSETHDFESHYTERLVGPLPEAAEQYRERSPLYRVADISGSVLLLQGEDDPIVPPSQSQAMAEALAARGLRCDYRLFPGESHGFRRAETLVAAYTAELAFYEEILLAPSSESVSSRRPR